MIRLSDGTLINPDHISLAQRPTGVLAPDEWTKIMLISGDWITINVRLSEIIEALT